MSAGILRVDDATAAIRDHLRRKYDFAEVWGDAAFDEQIEQWVAVVALTPFGPLVRMGFSLSISSPKEPSL